MERLRREITSDNVEIERAIQNAEASLRMEGLNASDAARNDCMLVLEGRMSDSQYMDNVRRRYAQFRQAEVVYGKV